MFELLARQPGVTDAPGAVPLRVSAGCVDFQQVGAGLVPLNQLPHMDVLLLAARSRAALLILMPATHAAALFPPSLPPSLTHSLTHPPSRWCSAMALPAPRCCVACRSQHLVAARWPLWAARAAARARC